MFGGAMAGRSFVAAAVAAVVVAASCAPNAPSAGTPSPVVAVGGVTAAAMTPREVVTRDIDHPPVLGCEPGQWRYNDPDPSKLPADYRDGTDYEYTSRRTPHQLGSAAALCGQRGPALDLAWEVSHGRDDVLIAVLDSGILWRGSAMSDLATKAFLNAGELPKPQGASTWDANGDGVFDVTDYAHDPRVADRNKSGRLDPEDLILTPAFDNGVDDDGNGYVDDISGWDFLFDDNDPLDNVDYGHGTGEARDSTSADGNGGTVGTCPQCRFLPVRVGDSFIAEGGRFAAGVLFGLDSGADVVQEALGAINNPPQAQAAIDAAYRRGVPVVASMADEASKHPNLPAVLDHTIAVNSVTNAVPGELAGLADQLVGDGDSDYLALNGCTNYGGIAWVTVPSGSCSSGATGLGSGMVGLMESVARDHGIVRNPLIVGNGHPGDNVLSANEVAQLLRSTADDVDFATPHPPIDPANNGGVDGTRYPTTPGWDATFGFGRVNTFEAVRAVAAGEIPPEADMTAPHFFDVLPTAGTLPVTGDLAAVRSSGYSYKVQWTTGLQAPPYPGGDVWRTVGSGSALTRRSPATSPTSTSRRSLRHCPTAGPAPRRPPVSPTRTDSRCACASW
ncbi:MAG: S8 family serine peptidase [Acidimicrobiales bacterium]